MLFAERGTGKPKPVYSEDSKKEITAFANLSKAMKFSESKILS